VSGAEVSIEFLAGRALSRDVYWWTSPQPTTPLLGLAQSPLFFDSTFNKQDQLENPNDDAMYLPLTRFVASWARTAAIIETGLAEIVFCQPADQYGIVEDHDVVRRFGQLMIVLSPAREIKGGVLCHRQNTVCVLISHPQMPRRHTHTLSKMFHPQHGEPLVPWHRRTVTYQ
jgi:hypothetical protein